MYEKKSSGEGKIRNEQGMDRKERKITKKERDRKRTRHHEQLLIRRCWVDVQRGKHFVPSLISPFLWRDPSVRGERSDMSVKKPLQTCLFYCFAYQLNTNIANRIQCKLRSEGKSITVSMKPHISHAEMSTNRYLTYISLENHLHIKHFLLVSFRVELFIFPTRGTALY